MLESFDTTDEIDAVDDLPDNHHDLERQFDIDDAPEGWSIFSRTRTPGTRRYEETVFHPGDTVTVHGTITSSETPGDQPVLSVPDDRPLLVSNLDADTLSHRYAWTYRKLFYVPIALILCTMLTVGYLLAL